MGSAWSYLILTLFAIRMAPLFVSVRVKLWWSARKGRRAFMDELRRQGVSEEGVDVLGRSYSQMKDELAGFLSWRPRD